MRISIPLLASLATAAVPLLSTHPAFAQATSSGGGSVDVSGQIIVGNPNPPPPPPPPPPTVSQPPPPPPTYQPPPPPPPVASTSGYIHDGFYFRFALGGGGMTATQHIDGFSPDPSITGGGVAMDLALGGTVAPGLVLGGDYIFQQAVKPTIKYGDTSIATDNNANFGVIGFMVDWFPDPEGGFHFGGTIGAAAMTVSNQTGTTTNSRTGFGGSLGVGYDFWVAREWSFGILGKFAGGSVGGTDNGNHDSLKVSTFSLLATVLFH